MTGNEQKIFGRTLSDKAERVLKFLDKWGQPSVHGQPGLEELLEMNQDELNMVEDIVAGNPLFELSSDDLAGLEVPGADMSGSQLMESVPHAAANGEVNSSQPSTSGSVSGQNGNPQFVNLPSTSRGNHIQSRVPMKNGIISNGCNIPDSPK